MMDRSENHKKMEYKQTPHHSEKTTTTYFLNGTQDSLECQIGIRLVHIEL
jgi:hypothetical protein